MPAHVVEPGFNVALDPGQLLREGLYRKERIVDGRNGVEIKLDGKWLINFCSNDYLGLAAHPKIKHAMQESVASYGTGSTASPLVCGKSRLHEALEQKLALITGRDRALILSCGYMANLAIQSALSAAHGQLIIQDRLCHASMVDGSIISRATLKRYSHRDPESLDAILKKTGSRPALVLTESVFSMDGDIAPLPELSRVCQQHNACLIVDDAHAFGVIGNNGLGSMDYFSLEQTQVPLIMATFGKALGVYGAFVAGTDKLIETLVQRARPYIYSTALPAPVIAAVIESLDILQQEPSRRARLQMIIKRFQAGAEQIGISTARTNTPIQPIMIGDAKKAMDISRLLEQDGIYISAIRPPTVPRNTSRLRITLSAEHTEKQVDRLLDVLAARLAEAGVIKR
jgi:8-amino-7-oxononanoate synthase